MIVIVVNLLPKIYGTKIWKRTRNKLGMRNSLRLEAQNRYDLVHNIPTTIIYQKSFIDSKQSKVE